jgi:hypothetical protein
MTFVEGLQQAVERNLAVPQYIAIMTNAAFIIDHIFPITQSQLREGFVMRNVF